MKFLSLYKQVEPNTPPSPEEMAAVGKLVEQGFQEGWLPATEGCLPSRSERASAEMAPRSVGPTVRSRKRKSLSGDARFSR